MEAALAFSAELMAATPRRERVDEFIVERLGVLVGAEVIDYAEVDCRQGSAIRLLRGTRFPGPMRPPNAAEWHLVETQNPFSAYAATTRSLHFTAKRLTDVTDMRVFRKTELSAIMGYGLPHDMQTWMPSWRGTLCSLEFARTGRDFTERDVAFVDAVRPALIAYDGQRALADMLRRLDATADSADIDTPLSDREHEVLDLVAEGASNAEIAQRLWISPATVRKHLEHIYDKLHVGNRTAALARTGRTSIRASPVKHPS